MLLWFTQMLSCCVLIDEKKVRFWMVEMRKSGGLRPENELVAKCRDELPVKLEIAEDDLEEEHGPLNKRSMLWSSGTSSLLMAPAKYNPLDEPSPLGLSLRKSPSLLELIQMTLTQSGDPKAGTLHAGAVGSGVKKESKVPGMGQFYYLQCE